MIRRMNHALAGGVVPPVEGRMLRLDGTPVSVESMGSRVQFGGRLAIQAILRDVSERKQAEADRERLLAEEQALAEEIAVTNEALQHRLHELQTQAEMLAVQEEALAHIIDHVPAGVYEPNKSASASLPMSKLAANGEELQSQTEELAAANEELQAQTEELLASEERYRSLFENMLDGFAYCEMLLDEDGRPDDFLYLAVNPAFEHLTGLTDVVGKRVDPTPFFGPLPMIVKEPVFGSSLVVHSL
jgi:PAS domain-containing protein